MKRTLYEETGLPTFQNRTFATRLEALNCDKGDVRLVQDTDTGLVFNEAFDPSVMNYDAGYQNFQAISAGFRSHLDQVAGIVSSHLKAPAIVEVGSGKGYFFELMQSRGLNAYGCDPAYEGANPRIVKQYFSPNLGLPSGSDLVLRHVLEHIPDPFFFLCGLRDSNGGAGLIYIEVPCLDWILQHSAWFDIFYEHVNYFRMADFRSMFGRVLYAERSFGGQYLSIVADLASLRTPLAHEPLEWPSDFVPRFDAYQPNAGVWGAASKGVIFTLLMERAGKPIHTVIDVNPQKHDQYLPASGHLVVSPETGLRALSAASPIYVMNSNYLAEVQRAAGAHFGCIAVDT